MDFQSFGGMVSAKGKFRPASSTKMTSSMGFLQFPQMPGRDSTMFVAILLHIAYDHLF